MYFSFESTNTHIIYDEDKQDILNTVKGLLASEANIKHNDDTRHIYYCNKVIRYQYYVSKM